MTVIFELLLEFLQIGLFSIGGGYAVIPLIKEHAVDLKGWLSIQEFTDIITISQMTPGPLAVNTSTFVGLQTGGLAGATAATLGCVFSGFVISLILCRCRNGGQSELDCRGCFCRGSDSDTKSPSESCSRPGTVRNCRRNRLPIAMISSVSRQYFLKIYPLHEQ